MTQQARLDYYKARGSVREDAPEQVHLVVRWVMVFDKETRQHGDTLCARLGAGEPLVPTSEPPDCPDCLRVEDDILSRKVEIKYLD